MEIMEIIKIIEMITFLFLFMFVITFFEILLPVYDNPKFDLAPQNPISPF